MKRTYTPPTVPLEDAEQRVIFQWATMETAARFDLRMLYAIPNGGKRAIKTAIALEEQGYKAVVCKGAEEAIKVIEKYLNNEK